MRTGQRTPSDMLPVLYERVEEPVSEIAERTLARDANAYLAAKRRRLTPASERGYRAVLDELVAAFPGARLTDFEPPAGALLIEGFLNARWGDLAPRTFNKSHSILSDFFEWFAARSLLNRNPMGTVDRAKTRPVHRQTFTDAQCALIFDANPEPRNQIALRLLLHYAIRKGALRGIRLEHFDQEKHRLIVFTKGEKIHTLPLPDDTIWQLLDQIGEPPHHYLLPKQTTRRRTPPRRNELGGIASGLETAYGALTEAADDPACARELAAVLAALDTATSALDAAVQAASTQTTYDLTQPIGEHGAHLWWYRCLQRAGIVAAGTTSGRRMHSARHTAIQRVLDKTGNLKAAQAVAGHATVGTTGDIYTDWSVKQTEDTLREVLA